MADSGWRSRGYLPHFDRPGVIQAVTFRLWDSLPTHVLQMLAEDPDVLSDMERREQLEQRLNAGYGRCYLKVPAVAGLVENALLYFDNERYRLYAWVIMPNHVHVLVELLAGSTLGKVLHSWKSYTAM